MKKILFLLVLTALSFGSAKSQTSYLQPGFTGTEWWSQMWNTSNVYLNVPTPSNLGSQFDTITNTATVNIFTASLRKGKVNVDTFLPYPLSGSGKITLAYSVLKCTGSPSVTLTPVGSLDGINWSSLNTAIQVVPTSLTVPAVGSFVFTEKNYRYYGFTNTGSASSTSSVQEWCYLQKTSQISVLK